MNNHESNLQIACVTWFRMQYPRLEKLLFAVPNGGKRNAITAKMLKAEGVVPGVSDLILLHPNKKWKALCIEMKWGDNRQSKLQREWESAIMKYGHYKYTVCNSFESFKETIDEYLKESYI